MTCKCNFGQVHRCVNCGGFMCGLCGKPVQFTSPDVSLKDARPCDCSDDPIVELAKHLLKLGHANGTIVKVLT